VRWFFAFAVLFISLTSQAAPAVPRASIPAATPNSDFKSANVGSRTIRYHCEGKGQPTVVIEQGGGISLESVFSWKQRVGWAALAPQIASLTRMCVYDRIGLGRSSKADHARTSFDIASELHAMLAVEKIQAPYVFAGQSLGGMNALAFANRYPSEVAGVVLVDSSHPQQLSRTNAVLPPPRADEPEALRGFRDGPERTMMGGEWFDFAKNAEQFTHHMSIGAIQLIVLTAAPQPPNDQGPLPREWQLAIEPVHQQLQRELTKFSTNSKQVVAQKAGHNIQLEEPQLVLDAITELVMKARAQ
jgi:pimeloyl-ACP methyl ester carboxylesterase